MPGKIHSGTSVVFHYADCLAAPRGNKDTQALFQRINHVRGLDKEGMRPIRRMDYGMNHVEEMRGKIRSEYHCQQSPEYKEAG